MKKTTKRSVKKDFKQYHFIGIGGMGMGNLALLMLAKGYSVSGSDVKEGELTRQLRDKGAKVYIGHDIRNLEGADCVVYSSAIKTDNPEMFQAISQHMPMLRRAELLAQLVNKEVGITCAGAHGKTTTSSMAALLLINAGLKPTTAIGGIVNQGDYNANLGIGRHIVAEVDESDGSFLYFSPHFSIITNIDFEHVDFYGTFEKIKEAYVKFVDRTVPGGLVIACGDDKVLLEIAKASGRHFTTYGFGDGNDWTARNIQLDAVGASYDCYHGEEFFGRFALGIPGKHNVLNSLSIVALGYELKIGVDTIQATLKAFKGVKRRFEKKGEAGGVLVIDDYGHHPTEIAATLQTAKTLDRKRLITVFQPHRFTRTKFLINEFAECFNLADYLILTDIYAASEKPIDGITTELVLERVRAKRPKNLFYMRKEEIVDYLLSIVQPGDMVLTLGAGDVTNLSDELVRRIEERARVTAPSYGRDMGMVGVLMGGCSSEREVSLRSGAAVLKALTEAGCHVKALDLTTEDPQEVKALLKNEGIEVAFIALHGRFGEDGTLQAILDGLDIPYQGCGPAASHTAFNKCLTQRVFEEKNVRTPRTAVLRGNGKADLEALAQSIGGFPVVVKPACEGSSIGISIARDAGELASALDNAVQYGQDIVVQEFVDGRELTVGILGQKPLPVVEIRAQKEHSFFDFQAKYKDKTTEYLVPATLTPSEVVRVQQEALKAYQAVGCDGFGRVDILLNATGVPYVLEINTIPGFTATSLLPKAAKAAGLDFQQLCLTLLDMAYGKKKTESVTHHG
ncbi:MAG: UDP-N-acetylmuramate--L-alanine ligase [Candidatus Omnitrophica bacterium]|nr:UDP-N-acetylmuramate--L-alanine ligase [Candidatus Omnitrophota bacterium]